MAMGTVYYWWKEIVSVVVIVTCIVLPIYLATYIEETVPKFDGKYKYQAEAYVYTNCHEMANNFIVAEDNKVRGFVRADDKNIDRILAVIMEYELDDSEQLKTWLLELKNGNYSNAVAFHNYCWLELDGDVGWAIKLKDKFK